jgi:radical SAM modification target selenobiotic family peptide
MMDVQDLKKFLAGLCIAGLLSGAGLGTVGCEKHGETS